MTQGKATADVVQLMKPKEVAALFGVHARTVVRWADAHRLHPVRMPSGHRRYRADEVMAFYNGTPWPPDGGAE